MSKLLFTHIPEAAHPQIKAYLEQHKIEIKIKAVRQTKHGDFRVFPNGSCHITVNTSPNPYRFLITLVHELAHFVVHKTCRTPPKPHGAEWKYHFRELMFPLLQPVIFPETLLRVLAQHLKNPKASSGTDATLVYELKKFDPPSHRIAVIDLKKGDHFKMQNGRVFIRGEKKVKRILCKEIHSGRTYLFSPHAEVEHLTS